MNQISFFVPGLAVAQGRPRFVVRLLKKIFRGGIRKRCPICGGEISLLAYAYDPEKSRAWKQHVALFAKQHAPDKPLDCALKMELEFILPRPKSVSVKKRPLPTVKPDLDNLVKAVKDGLTGIIYRDDSLIVEIVARKVYDDGPEAKPGVFVEIESVEAAND